jgi:serine/threonine-protein kinase
MPRVSPDGSRLAFVLTEGTNSHIWVHDFPRGIRSRLTSGPGINTYPIWSPDGQYVVFSSGGQLFWTRADGAERPQPLTKSQRVQFASSFTPDGKQMAFFEHDSAGKSLIQTVRVDNQAGQLRVGEPELFRQLPSSNPYPAFSPDGKWLAFSSAESGMYEVYVRAFPDRGQQWQISTGGGTLPAWSRTRNELFYRTDDQRLMVSTYSATADSFVASRPRAWSEKQMFNTGNPPNFDLAPDGQRFAALMPVEGPSARETQRQITLLLNFFDEVRRRVAVAVR